MIEKSASNELAMPSDQDVFDSISLPLERPTVILQFDEITDPRTSRTIPVVRFSTPHLGESGDIAIETSATRSEILEIMNLIENDSRLATTLQTLATAYSKEESPVLTGGTPEERDHAVNLFTALLYGRGEDTDFVKPLRVSCKEPDHRENLLGKWVEEANAGQEVFKTGLIRKAYASNHGSGCILHIKDIDCAPYASGLLLAHLNGENGKLAQRLALPGDPTAAVTKGERTFIILSKDSPEDALHQCSIPFHIKWTSPSVSL